MIKHLALAALLVSGTAQAATAPPAAAFYNSIGVVGHVYYANPIWYQRLGELGVANLRTKLATNKGAADRLRPFFSSGGKVNATIVASSGGTLSKDEATRNLAFLKNYVGLANVNGIEGPNEFNANTLPNWATVERDFVKWLHDTVRADAAFNNVPLVAPSVFKRRLEDYAALGDLSPWVDRGCIHYYSGQRRPTLTGKPSFTMEASLKAAAKLAPGKPIRMTETGWQAPGGNIPISNTAAAKYILRDYFDSFGYGVEKTFLYQIQDDQTNLFGLTDPNGNPKPQFFALKNLVALFKDAGAAAGSLDYTISGAPADMKQYAFRKSDGNYLLVMYRDVDSWKSGRDLTYAPVNVTVSFGSAYSRLEVFEPTYSAEVKKSAVSVSSIQVPVADHVVVVRVMA